MNCPFAFEEDFLPPVDACRRSFDFSLFFEETVFSIIPSSIFILLAVLRLFILWQRPRGASKGYLHIFKLLVCAFYIILELALLVEYCLITSGRTRASLASAALSLVAALLVGTLSYFEHGRSLAPSALLFMYLFLTAILDIARTRTLWLSNELIISGTFQAALVVKVALIVVENWDKRKILQVGQHEIANEKLAGIFSRSLFLWLWPLLLRGFQKEFAPADLGPIDSKLSSTELETASHEGKLPKSKSQWAFYTAIIRSLGWSAVKPVLPRLFLTGFTFAQPFLVSAILDYVQNSESQPINHGYGLIGACLFAYTGIAIATAWYWQQMNRVVTMLRRNLVSSIFQKSLKLKEDTDSGSRAITLMIADVQRIVSGVQSINELWAGCVETGIATWLLQRQVGLACLPMIGLALLCGFASLQMSKLISPRQQAWFAAMQKRLGPTSKVLNSFKAVKMLGDDDRATSMIESLRDQEIRAARPFRDVLVAAVSLSYCTLTVSPVLVFATYIGIFQNAFGNLDTTRLFTSLVLISLFASPLVHLFQVIPAIGAAKGCFERIKEYLDSEEQVDCRTIEERSSTSPTASQLDKSLEAEKIILNNASRLMISISCADLRWNTDGKAILRDVTVQVLRGEHILIMGPVGSGKSLLLKAILGEAEKTKGSITVFAARVGYCSQKPWLENLSGEKTISRHSNTEESWMKTVSHACALEDMERLREFRSGSIGSGGAILSGGQRQRLALARAVYARPELLIMDDPFSALDGTTRELIVKRLMGPQGLLRRLGTTVIYSAHNDCAVKLPDRIFEVSGEGFMAEQTSSRLPIDIQESNMYADTDTEIHGESPLNLKSKGEVPVEAANAEDGFSQHVTTTKAAMSDFEVYKMYFHSVGALDATIFLGFSVIFAITLKFPDIWIQWWSDASYGTGSRSISYWIGIYALLEALPLLTISVWLWHLMRRVVPQSARRLHWRLLNTAIHASFPFMSTADVGGLINRFNQDLMFIDTTLPIALLNTSSEFFVAIVQIVFVTVAVVYVLGLLPILTIVLYFVQHFYLRTSKQLRHLELESKASLHANFLDTCSGLSTIRAFEWQQEVLSEHLRFLDVSQQPFYLLFSVQRWLQLVLNLIVAGLIVIVLGVAIRLEGKVSPSALGVAFLNITNLGETLTNVIVEWTSLETSLGSIARIASFCRDTPLESKPETQQAVNSSWPDHGHIEFKNVRASYDSENRTPILALQDVTLDILPGEKVAICGRTGSGKSSLVVALMSMLPCTSGSITIDGVAVSSIEGTFLRGRMHVVPQDVFALSGRTRDELNPSGELDDATMVEVLEKCGIWDKVQQSGGLEGPLDTTGFSAGEAQLFCLARAILKAWSSRAEGGVVILDEATSSVDAATETKIQTLVTTMFAKRTVLSVMHRLDTAVKYDKILVMEQGRVLDYGSPEEVIQRCELFRSFRT